MNIQGQVEVRKVTKEIIEVLGVKYYSETYLKAMMDRKYEEGLRKGQTVHVAQIEKCSNCA